MPSVRIQSVPFVLGVVAAAPGCGTHTEQRGGTKMLMRWSIAVGLAAIAHVAACSSSSDPTEGLATTSFNVSGDFSGNSVRICGARNPAADGKFRCDSELPGSASTIVVPGDPDSVTTECPCFDFAAD